MNQGPETRFVVVATSILLATVVAVWLVVRPSSRSAGGSATADATGEGGVPSRTASTGGIRPLQSDPATPPLEWSRNGLDEPDPSTVSLNEYLKSIASTTDAAALQELLEVLEWTMPFGQEGEVGTAMSECAKKFESQLDEQCHWETDFVVKRTGSGTGELQFLRARVSESSATCSAYASCATSAWAKAGPMPMPESLGDTFAFSRMGRGTYWIGSEPSTSEEKYRALSSDVEQRLRDLQRLDVDNDSPLFRYNEMYAQHELREFERMLREDLYGKD